MFGRSICLRKTVASVVAILVIFMAISMGLVVGQHSINRIKQDEGRMLAEIARQMSDRLQNTMRFRALEVKTLASLPALRDPVQAQILVDSLKSNDNWLAWSGVTDKDGLVLAGSNGVLRGQNISGRPVYQESMKNGDFTGDVHEAVLLNSLLNKPGAEPMRFVDTSTVILDDKGKKWGVLAAHFNWIWADSIVSSLIEPIKDMKNLEIIVIARDNTVLLGPSNLISKKLSVPSSNIDETGGSGWVVESWPNEGEYITGWANERGGQDDMSNLGWTALVRQPVSAAFESADEIRMQTIVFGIVFAFLFSLTGWILINKVTKPLIKITNAADRVKNGDHTTEIPHIVWAKELKILSESLRGMVDSLTKQKSALAQMSDIADHDRLTNLPNRRQMERHLELLALSKTPSSIVYIFYMDLDGFKPVNDTWGHAVGDHVLQVVAERIRNCLRAEDLPVRLGGDEFVIVMKPGIGETDAQTVAERIISRMREPITIDMVSTHTTSADIGENDNVCISIGCSMGMSGWNVNLEPAGNALARADKALYEAKSMGKNCLKKKIAGEDEE